MEPGKIMPHLLFTGEPDAGEKLLKVLERQFSVRVGKPEVRTSILLDTFDWRLYRAGLTLKFCRRTYLLQQLHKRQATDLASSATRQRPCRFYWEFPDGDLKEALAPVIEVRALLPILSFKENIRELRLVNREEKTLVKLEFITLTTPEGRKALQLSIIPLRGYDKAARRLEQLISGVEGLQPVASPFDILQTIGNLQPGSYSGKFDLKLKPGEPAAGAARSILLHLLNTMKANEEGIREDLDSEFLHDFRVAVRRTRAVLGQVKRVFPAEKTQHFRQIFSELGRQTNLLRDLDVYLLHREHFRSLLPPTLQPGLETFFRKLARKRRFALNRVRKLLNSADYQQQMEEWESFLKQVRPETSNADNARRPVKELASYFIYRQYRRIIKDGQRITTTSPDEDLHQLRIDGKKLRYLLEFFASLYPPDQIKTLIVGLKRLQDNLGKFNDLSVQQDYLRAYLESLDKSSRVEVLNAAAIGGLLARLHEHHQQVRRAFARTFSRFNTPETQNIFHQLFKLRESS